jgi:hypothetical protein
MLIAHLFRVYIVSFLHRSIYTRVRSTLINDELTLEAKKSRSPPPPDVPGSSGVLAPNVDPVIPKMQCLCKPRQNQNS